MCLLDQRACLLEGVVSKKANAKFIIYYFVCCIITQSWNYNGTKGNIIGGWDESWKV